MRQEEIKELEAKWQQDERWCGVKRPYPAEKVERLSGTVKIEHTLATRGAEKLWRLLHDEPYVATLSALTGAQAVQQVQAGLKALYVSGWQIAGDMNSAGQTYPDQSLYPADSAPALVSRLNAALQRTDEICHASGICERMPDWYVPIVADGEAGFGGVLNAFELTKALIEAGAAAVHYEDQLSSAKKCGHMGGKVLVPVREAIQKLVAARLAADICDVPTLIIARTDAIGASLLTSDMDDRDRPFLTGSRTEEGYFEVRHGLELATKRALAFAPYADVLWAETSTPDLEEARRFAEGVKKEFPNKLLAYNCSPSFNWKLKLEEAAIGRFQRELGAMGYAFQFVTLAAFHSINASMFRLAHAYRDNGMLAYAKLQEREFEMERQHGYRAVKHQAFVGAGYFDEVAQVVNGTTTTSAMHGSTEESQFREKTPDFEDAEGHHRDDCDFVPIDTVGL